MTQMPSIEVKPRRVVFLHTTGPLAGLHQINGHSDEFEGRAAPLVTDPFQQWPRPTETLVASLVKVTPRFYLYKEIDLPHPGRRHQ